jgi:hypothetical protein
MEERGEFPNRPQWLKKPGVGIAGHSKTSILGHPGASVLRSYLGFFQSFIFVRPTGLQIEQVSARPCFKPSVTKIHRPGNVALRGLSDIPSAGRLIWRVYRGFLSLGSGATGTTVYLENKGNVRDGSEDCCLHESPPATMLSDRTDNQLRLDEIEKISV